jgi:hypothetical protein
MKRILCWSAALAVVVGLPLSRLVLSSGAVAAPPVPKVLICHVDPDEGVNPHVIFVAAQSVEAHLAHGDCLAESGALPGDPCTCD